MKVFACNKLTHTLQTCVGMIVDHGRPQQRLITSLPRHLSDNKRVPVAGSKPEQLSERLLEFLFGTCVLESRLPHFNDSHKPDSRVSRFESNISACCNRRVDLIFLKKNIATRERLDLEQAAAAVISAIRNDTTVANKAAMVGALCDELDPRLITESCMWLERHQWDQGSSTEEQKFGRLVRLLERLIAWSIIYDDPEIYDVDSVSDWPALLPLLLRVRRSSPRSRALFIPQWVFEEAGVKPSPARVIWNEKGLVQPGHEPMVPSDGSDDIILGRKGFRALQRRLVRHRRFWDPEILLRNAITDLKANAIYASDHINSLVLPSQNTLYVAHYFFALQRRLQRKVVSDLHWTGFLAKGESGNVLQNSPEIPTTFEQRLAEFSGQTGVPVIGPVLPQIDHCCVLMERYVSVYGQGDRDKLTFAPDRGGGSGRGPVDDYNLLCDILKTLCKAAKEQGLAYPEPSRKFLAKDIMAYNDSFGDDAFAMGRVPGWEKWLAQRRELGVIEGMERLEVSEDVEMAD